MPHENVNTMRSNRKLEILNAALICFNHRGIAATSIEEIKKNSHASIGSIYHHFGSKDGIAYALYVNGLQDYHNLLMEKLEEAETPESKIKTFVIIFLDWVEENPELANFIFSARSYLVNSKRAEDVEKFHDGNGNETASIIKELVVNKGIKELPGRVYSSLLVGPAQHFSQHLMNKDTALDLEKEKAALAQVIWESLAP